MNFSSINIIESETDSLYLSSRNDDWNTREGDVRQKILKMTQQKQNISSIYRDCLRSMIHEFSDIVIFAENETASDVKVIHANQERAIAKIHQENNIILPIISISQVVSENADNRRRYKSLLIHEKVWNEETQRATRVLSLAPRAITIQYDIYIWSKYKSDLDQISEQIRLKFNPDLIVNVNSTVTSNAYLNEESDSGSSIAPDKEERLLQKSFRVILETYIDSPRFLVTKTGKITEFNAEVSFLKPNNKTKPSN